MCTSESMREHVHVCAFVCHTPHVFFQVFGINLFVSRYFLNLGSHDDGLHDSFCCHSHIRRSRRTLVSEGGSLSPVLSFSFLGQE